MKPTATRFTIITAIATVLIMTAMPIHPQDRNVAAIEKAEGAGHVQGKRWAIVVGVNDYDDPRVNDLKFAVNDAKLVADALTSSGLFERVFLFADGASGEFGAEPTFMNVLKKVNVISQNAGPEDMVLFFFSGHGFPDEKEGYNYLAAKDTDPDMLLKSGIGLQELYRFMNESQARAKIVLLDACHSGARKDKGDVQLKGNYLYNGEGSVTIGSSQFDQSSYEWPEKQAGAFTWFLVQGMGGEADKTPFGNGDGVVISHELEQYVTQAVQTWAVDHNKIQTPRGKRNMTGDVVLGLAGGVVTPPPPTENMQAEKRCVDNDLFWYGDRGSQGDRINACTANSTCSNGRCICNPGFDTRDGKCVKKELRCPLNMVLIPSGTFTMGCSTLDIDCEDTEMPSMDVYVNSFCMDRFEYPNRAGQTPKSSVGWHDAKQLCEAQGKRLPTEAEWEKAARGGMEGDRYTWGDTWDHTACNHGDKPGDRFNHTASPAGSFAPNGYGLYDMAGNLYEWVEDCFDENWYSKMPGNNPLNTSTGCDKRVLRGGSWGSDRAWLTRVSLRGRNIPTYTVNQLGFRCAKDAE